MAVLGNSRHEQFAQAVAKGEPATKAYVLAGFSKGGAAQSAGRLLKNADVCVRIKELQQTISANLTAASIRDVNARVKGYDDRRTKLLDGIDLLLKERGADLVDAPGGPSGLLCRDYKGKDATQVVYKVDSGLVSLLAQVLAIEQQAARELGQWMEKVETTSKEGDLARRLAAGRARVAAKAKK